VNVAVVVDVGEITNGDIVAVFTDDVVDDYL